MSRKLALIIGNNDYEINPLKNCVNDAISLADVLRRVAYEVELHTNLKSEDMYECIKTFTETIRPDDFIIFFFAGHAVQWGDQNFLLPRDNRKIVSGRDMQRYATNAQENINEMANMKPHFILFLLDCCREYWLPSTARTTANNQVGGLNKMIAPPGTLIAFACGSGRTAADRSSDGSNGIFTKYLLKHITTPGMDIEMVLRKVATDVANETDNSQIPYRLSSIMTDNIYLVPIEKSSTSSTSQHMTVPSFIGQSINILLIGEKGVGKSTFINAFVNYLSFKTVQQAQSNRPLVLKPLSFHTMTNDTFEERTITFGDFDHRDQSATQRCQTYTFNLRQNDGKKLCLIDTPSFEDSHGSDQDNSDNNIKHILDYVNTLTHLNAVCFLLQPDASRLMTSFQSCFGQLINRLGRNARENVIFCFTNALMTSYMPGSTASLLRNMFTSLSMNDIPFSKENTFFFENESFRYLLAVQNGINFNDQEKAEYMMSWSESVDESSRLLNLILRRPSYRIIKK